LELHILWNYLLELCSKSWRFALTVTDVNSMIFYYSVLWDICASLA